MKKNVVVALAVMFTAVPLAIYGCKGKTENFPEMPKIDSSDTMTIPAEQTSQSQTAVAPSVTEPAQIFAVESAPPTASQVEPRPAAASSVPLDKNKSIQLALQKAGFYSGTVDGKIGPKTKQAIEAFQKEKALKVDGKVGPRTWAELEKYLTQ